MMIISNGTRKGSWHVGETMNIPEGRVLTFIVDGDELNWLMDILYLHPDVRVVHPAKYLTPIL